MKTNKSNKNITKKLATHNSLNDFDEENKDNLLLEENQSKADIVQEPEVLPEDNEDDFENLDLDLDLTSDFDKELPLYLDEHKRYDIVPAKSNLPQVATKDSLQIYLNEINRFPLLSPEEEIELTQKVKESGDTDAAFRLISSHLRLVVRIAMDFQRKWMQNVLDLVQEGNVGLMRAVHKFDPDKGIKFSYYATFWIKAYILKFIMDNWRMVKIGTTQSQRKLFYNLNKEKQKLIAEGFDPDSAMLADKLGVSVEAIDEMQTRLNSSDMSLDTPINDEYGSSSRIEFLPALGPGIEDGYASEEISNLVQDSIKDILPDLSDKEIYILEHRLLTDDPTTLREIGEKYNVTRERIRQLEARLLVKLKNHLSNDIKDFSENWIEQK